MNVRKDFWNMTTDELLPIVSMRPGKEYTREELKEAREAFMKSLSGEQQVQAPDFIQATEEPAPGINEPEIAEPEITKPDFPEPAKEVKEEISFYSEEISEEIDAAKFDTKEIISLPPDNEKSAPENPDGTMKKNLLARFLYTFYTCLILPFLAIEAILVTLSAAAVVVFCNGEKNILECFAAAMLYSVIIALVYHQFMHGTRVGIILNRALIIGGLIFGFVRIDLGYLYSGIIFIAVSALYLIFFTGYESAIRKY